MLRRRTLLLGLGGALLTAGGGAALVATTGYTPDPRDVPVACTAKELVIVRAIVEALLPADDGAPSGADLGVVQRIDEELWSAAPAVREDLRRALSVLEWWPVLAGFGGRLSRLPPAEAALALQHALERGPRAAAQAASAYKQLTHLFGYAADASWAAIGYDGPWVETPRPPPSSLAYRALLDARRPG